MQRSDADIARQLFTPSPERLKRSRDGGKGRKQGRGGARSAFRLSLPGVIFFFLLCGLAVVLSIWLNNSWLRELTLEDVSEFFSNKQLNAPSSQNESFSIFYFHGRPLFGWLGALPLAGMVGFLCGIFTFLFMFYDSDVPGNFPPTPVSPRSRETVETQNSRWHLGYIFVPVNALVTFSLALFYMRLHMGLPLV